MRATSRLLAVAALLLCGSLAFGDSPISNFTTTVIPTLGTANSLLGDSFSRHGLTPYDFGAKCDGSTDDSTALQAWLNIIGTSGSKAASLVLPSSLNGCLFATALTLNATTQGPIFIRGFGPNSRLRYTGTGNALTITGSCGSTYDKVYISNISLSADGAADSAEGIELNGVAAYGLQDVSFNAGAKKFTIGIRGRGAQQGRIVGGYAQNVGTDIKLEDCGGTVSSNGVFIGGGRTTVATTVAVDLEGGASGDWIEFLHETSSTTGIIVNQTNNNGGSGRNFVSHDTFEANGTRGLDVQAGTVDADHLNDYNGGTQFAHVSSGATLHLAHSLINGPTTLDAGSFSDLYNNTLNGAVTNNEAASANTVAFQVTNQMVLNYPGNAQNASLWIKNTSPSFDLTNTANAANNKTWETLIFGNCEYHRAVDDGAGTGTPWVLPCRTAGTTTIASVTLTATTVAIVGAETVSAGAVISGALSSINASSNFETDINTGTSTGAIKIGNSGTTGVTSLLGLSTGTNADTLCLSAGGVVLLQAAACTISSKRFKNQLGPLNEDALSAIDKLPVATFTYKQDAKHPNPDHNALSVRAGVYAEDVAKAMPKCAIYENDMKTPKSYDDKCLIGYLVRSTQQLAARVEKLEAVNYSLRKAMQSSEH